MTAPLYRLAANCRILSFEQLNFRKAIEPRYLEALEAGECFILERKGLLYLVNPTIKTFLESFGNGASFSEVLKNLSHQASCSQDAIEPAVQSFFEQLRALEILLPTSEPVQETHLPKDKSPAIVSGTVIGNLRFEKRIFTNPKIEIYKAFPNGSTTPVAVKLLRGNSADRKRRQSFMQEFFLLDELGKHPNICQFIELVQHDPYLFGVIEYIDGLPGRKYIKEQQPDLVTKLRILDQFFDAMAFIHRRDYLHGDLHLSNLLIDVKDHLKIIDFNMSNRANPKPNELIREGGVHHYIAPEKVDSRAFKIVKGAANFASEVFQMGVITYFILYEVMPFQGFIWKDLARRICDDTPELALESPHGEIIPTDVLQVLRKMLFKDPVRRYPNANILCAKWKKRNTGNPLLNMKTY
jgi:serine/threonine protein kinase